MQALCTVCGGDALIRSLTFGRQPLSTCLGNHPTSSITTPLNELSIGFCRSCATIQLVDRFPLSILQEKYPGGQFKEPSAHLPAVADKLIELNALRTDSSILGLSYIDIALMDLLSERGYGSGQIVSFDQIVPWQKSFGLESMQSVVSNPEFAKFIGDKHGKLDLICARFILEHAESAYTFLRTLVQLVNPGGYLVIEVPDAGKMLSCSHHALVWEDHFTYFSPSSLLRLISGIGALPVDLSLYSYAYENVIVAILQVDDTQKPSRSVATPGELEVVTEALQEFAEKFDFCKQRVREELKQRLSAGERLAIFGAGHHSAKYLNFYGVADLVEYAIDDNPNKQSLYMPGTDIAIKDSRFLIESKITTCLSPLSPESEMKVRQSIAPFFERGGEFIPILEQNGVNE